MSTRHKLNEILSDNFFYDDGDDATCFWQSEKIGDARVKFEVSVFVREGDIYRRYDEMQEQTAYETGRVLELLREAGFEECSAYSFLTREAASEQDERVQFAAKKI